VPISVSEPDKSVSNLDKNFSDLGRNTAKLEKNTAKLEKNPTNLGVDVSLISEKRPFWPPQKHPYNLNFGREGGAKPAFDKTVSYFDILVSFHRSNGGTLMPRSARQA